MTALAAPALHADAPRQASAAEVEAATARLPPLFADRDTFPEDVVAVAARRRLVWSRPEGGLLLVPVLGRFRGANNAYCRFATLRADLGAATLVPAAQEADAPDCRGFRAIHYLDVNADGALDMAAFITIKANSFEGDVDIPVVYLSQPGAAGGYCYSPLASQQLTPADMGSGARVGQALERGKRRLGGSAFACGGRP